MPSLSAIVAVAATVPAVGSVVAAKHEAILVASCLSYSAAVGYIMAIAATDWLANASTGILGKVGGRRSRVHYIWLLELHLLQAPQPHTQLDAALTCQYFFAELGRPYQSVQLAFVVAVPPGLAR